jgi:hypothetical protein
VSISAKFHQCMSHNSKKKHGQVSEIVVLAMANSKFNGGVIAIASRNGDAVLKEIPCRSLVLPVISVLVFAASHSCPRRKQGRLLASGFWLLASVISMSSIPRCDKQREPIVFQPVGTMQAITLCCRGYGADAIGEIVPFIRFQLRAASSGHLIGDRCVCCFLAKKGGGFLFCFFLLD